MSRIIIHAPAVKNNTIRYMVSEEGELGLLQQDQVELYTQFHYGDGIDCDLTKVPQSILLVSISLYLLPITWFYDVELVIPEMDEDLYNQLPSIYKAYSKIYGPFNPEWKGKVSVDKVIKNTPENKTIYDKVVFFSGGVDACHAGIDNPGNKTLFVSLPDIEWQAQNEGALRDEKFSLIKTFSSIVGSTWMLVSNNFNIALYDYPKIQSYLTDVLKLHGPAFICDGFPGIRYLPNMCSVAPIAYVLGIKKLVMGSSFEQIEDDLQVNYDGTNPELLDSIKFFDVVFDEQDGLQVRRSRKVFDIIDWCNKRGVKIKMQVCFSDNSVQCGYCNKCVRTQMNILCAGENPRDWGFDNFDAKEFAKYVKAYRYKESNPCWLWDNIETIDNNRVYPYCNNLLHWLKKIGYKKYSLRANTPPYSEGLFFRRICRIRKYPHYVKVIIMNLINVGK